MISQSSAMSTLFGVLVASAAIWGAPVTGAAPSDEPTPTPTTTKAKDNPYPKISYEVTGTGVAGYLTYQTNNVQEHAVNVPLPWSMELTGMLGNNGHVRPYSVSAQGVGPGAISCTLKVDGKVVKQFTATGDPARVVCAHY